MSHCRGPPRQWPRVVRILSAGSLNRSTFQLFRLLILGALSPEYRAIVIGLPSYRLHYPRPRNQVCWTSDIQRRIGSVPPVPVRRDLNGARDYLEPAYQPNSLRGLYFGPLPRLDCTASASLRASRPGGNQGTGADASHRSTTHHVLFFERQRHYYHDSLAGVFLNRPCSLTVVESLSFTLLLLAGRYWNLTDCLAAWLPATCRLCDFTVRRRQDDCHRFYRLVTATRLVRNYPGIRPLCNVRNGFVLRIKARSLRDQVGWEQQGACATNERWTVCQSASLAVAEAPEH